MRTIAVVVVDELLQNVYEVAPVDHEQVIKTLGANRPHDTLRDRVGVRSPARGLDSDDANGSGPFLEVTSIDGVAIVNQVT